MTRTRKGQPMMKYIEKDLLEKLKKQTKKE